MHDDKNNNAIESTPTRLLLVANRTCPCPTLPSQVVENIGGLRGEVLVLAPALNTRLRHRLSDSDAAVRAARERMRATIDELRRLGLTVTGEVGDADPLTAIADALDKFAATRIMISTWPAEMSNWLEKDLPSRAAERFHLPIHHIVSRYDAPIAAAIG
ncbi:MAG TPA: hypothetical protein VG228_04030 [Solirubrobacteraceae bacterium]|nr:hypothetical protein [Solirubrobacteraceae bacterium]